jgi:hypothetical protein
MSRAEIAAIIQRNEELRAALSAAIAKSEAERAARKLTRL